MGTFLTVIGFIGLVVFIVMAIVSKIKKTKKGNKMMLYAVGCLVLMIIGGILTPATDSTQNSKSDQPKQEKKADQEKKTKTDTQKAMKQYEKEKEKKESKEIGKSTVAALESNNFMKFVNEYKKLGKNKSIVWDNQIYGKKVTWTGTVEHAGTSEVFVYGLDDYKGETWNELGDKKKLYYCFVAKYKDPTQFKNLKQGDKITVTGDLTSRGDFDLDYNWKIYNAVLQSKQ